MTVLGIGTASSLSQSPATSRAAQARQYFQELGDALAAENSDAALAALKGLQANIRGGGQGKSQNTDNAKVLLSALASALESGNLGEAQEVYARLQKDTGEIRGKGDDKAGRSRGEDSVTVGGTPLPPATPEVPPADSAASGEIDIMA